jgi:hypothetical protein
MDMWRLKSCPRCGGDMYIERNLDGWEEQCLQCSYVHEHGRYYALEKEVTLVIGGIKPANKRLPSEKQVLIGTGSRGI